MKLVFIGPPGSGKGTLGREIADRYALSHISTGDIIRHNIQNDTEIGMKTKETLSQGNFLPDYIMIELVQKVLGSMPTQSGYILDGFPRTIPQATWILSHIHIDYYVFLHVPVETIIERLSGRRIHPDSNRIYHIINSPPKVDGKDDVTGEALVQRDDDQPEKILRRLDIYEETTRPVINYIISQTHKHVQINSAQHHTQVLEEIVKTINLS